MTKEKLVYLSLKTILLILTLFVFHVIIYEFVKQL